MKKRFYLILISLLILLFISITSMGAYSYFALSESSYGKDDSLGEPISKIYINYIKK